MLPLAWLRENVVVLQDVDDMECLGAAILYGPFRAAR
jgi:hypothetical protein